MQAFVVTIIVPNGWKYEDILCACNYGIRQRLIEKPELPGREGILTSATIAEHFYLSNERKP